MAEEITGSRYQRGRGPVGGEREVRDRLLRGLSRTLLHRVFLRIPKASYRESGGVPGSAPSGDFGSRIRLWKAVAKEITGSRCLPARGPVGGERSAPWSVANRRLEALLKARKRKTGRARRCCTDSFYGFRKQRV